MPEMQTTQLHAWVDRIRGGEPGAEDELLQAVGRQLQELASRMLRKYPSVARWAETGDVFQTAAMRLLGALKDVRPASTREFYSLAAVQMRRELLDMARRFGGPLGLGRNHHSTSIGEPVAPPNDLERWTRFHEVVEGLPPDERETIGLVFYHGWTNAQVAELMQVTERTVERWRKSALDTLKRLVG